MEGQVSIKNLRQTGREQLSDKLDYNVAALETDLLLSDALGEERLFLELYPDKLVDFAQAERFSKNLALRLAGMPMAYLLGHREFMGYEFWVERGILIPRSDTEIVVEQASLLLEKSEDALGLEIGVGTGIISLTLLSRFPKLRMCAVDINPQAIALCQKNAAYLENQLADNGVVSKIMERFSAHVSDLFSNLTDEKFDFIISNPPYIQSDVIPTLATDVKDYEPMEALDGGEDGLYFYKKILSEGMDRLKTGGFFAFEIGYDQSEAVEHLMKSCGLYQVRSYKDLAGHFRAITGYKI
ncbi:MAG: peptide chain release factor N(5)-glutamine methyltransferase [Peptostreptococcaceae bacterium]|nr:peptide chain release factor N(5)-glutamine methyltransferase [Peptostreptococcaceae bacterium]